MLVPHLIGGPHHLSLTAPLFLVGHQRTRGKLLQPSPNHPDLKLLGFRVINPPDPPLLGGTTGLKIKRWRMGGVNEALDPPNVQVSRFGPPQKLKVWTPQRLRFQGLGPSKAKVSRFGPLKR